MAQLFDAQAVAMAENKFDSIDKGVDTALSYAKYRMDLQNQRAITEAKLAENEMNRDIISMKSMEADMDSIRDIYATTNPKMKNIKIKMFEERKKVQGKPVSPIFKEIMNDDSYMESFTQLDELLKDKDIMNQPGKLFQLHKELNSIYGSERADSIFKSFVEANKVGTLAGKAEAEAIYKQAMTDLAKERANLVGAQAGKAEAETGLVESKKGLIEAQTGLAGAKADLTQEQVGTQKEKTGLTKAQTEATKAGIGQKEKALSLQEKGLEIKKDWQELMKNRYADLDENEKKRLSLQDKQIENKIKSDNKRLDIMSKAAAARAAKSSSMPAGTVKGYIDKLSTKGEASKRNDEFKAQIDLSTAALNQFQKTRSKQSLMQVTAALASAYGMGTGRALSDKDIEMIQTTTGYQKIQDIKAWLTNQTEDVVNSGIANTLVGSLRSSINTAKESRLREAGGLLETDLNVIPRDITMPEGKKSPILHQWESDLGVEIREDKNGRLYLMGKSNLAEEKGKKKQAPKQELNDSQKSYIQKAKKKYSYEEMKTKAKERGVNLNITKQQWDSVLP